VSLVERALAVASREDFVQFLELFCAELGEEQAEWENDNLSSFLEAMLGWCQGMEWFYHYRGEDVEAISSWRFMADVLMGAQITE